MKLEQIQDAIRFLDGPAVVIGARGSGKTSLCSALAEPVDTTTFTALIVDRVESVDELLVRILQEFGISRKSTSNLPGRVTTRELFDALECFLRGLIQIKATAVLIVDDAQNLPAAALARIAALADLEADRKPLLKVVLAGTPALRDMLNAPEGSVLDQGVAIRCELDLPTDTVEQVPSWLQRRVSPLLAVVVALLASALAVLVTGIVYERLGY